MTTDQGELRANAVLVTFDDGYAGVSEHAYPLLRNEAIPLAVFVVSSAIGATDVWMRNADPDHTAYPHGRLNDAVRATVAEAVYACALSTRSGFNRTREDPLLILRIHVYGTDTAGALLRESRLGANDGARRALARGGLAVS